MSRVHIGEKNGRIGAWVSPVGVDASAEGVRMILDSDLDNLKPHWHDRRKITVGPALVPSGSGWAGSLADKVFTFPSLPFIPLAFMALATEATNYQMSFPPGVNWNASVSSEWNMLQPRFRMTQSSLTVLDDFHIWNQNTFVYVWVFANPIEGI